MLSRGRTQVSFAMATEARRSYAPRVIMAIPNFVFKRGQLKASKSKIKRLSLVRKGQPAVIYLTSAQVHPKNGRLVIYLQ